MESDAGGVDSARIRRRRKKATKMFMPEADTKAIRRMTQCSDCVERTENHLGSGLGRDPEDDESENGQQHTRQHDDVRVEGG